MPESTNVTIASSTEASISLTASDISASGACDDKISKWRDFLGHLMRNRKFAEMLVDVSAHGPISFCGLMESSL